MRTLLLIATVALTVGTSSITGQQVPQGALSLTGTWMLDAARSDSAASGTPRPVEILVIRQTTDGLVVDRQREGKSKVVTYAFSDTLAAEGQPMASRPTPAEAATAPQPVGTSGTIKADLPASSATSEDHGVPIVGVQLQQARASVKDGRIVLTTVVNVNGKAVSTDEIIYTTEDGRELVIERELTLHHGYTGATRTDASAKDVFVRTQ